MKKVLILLLLLTAQTSAAECISLDFFKTSLNQRETFEQKKNYIKKLSPQDLSCLYWETKELHQKNNVRLVQEDLASHDARDEMRVEKHWGWNSLAVMRSFEKHAFWIKDHVFGYNVSEVGRMLHSPGFYAFKTVGRRIFLDYRGDLKTEIPQADYALIKGIAFERVKNNKGNLIFGGLVDEMYKIDEGVLIGLAYRVQDRKWQERSYFVLLKQ